MHNQRSIGLRLLAGADGWRLILSTKSDLKSRYLISREDNEFRFGKFEFTIPQ